MIKKHFELSLSFPNFKGFMFRLLWQTSKLVEITNQLLGFPKLRITQGILDLSSDLASRLKMKNQMKLWSITQILWGIVSRWKNDKDIHIFIRVENGKEVSKNVKVQRTVNKRSETIIRQRNEFDKWLVVYLPSVYKFPSVFRKLTPLSDWFEVKILFPKDF